MRCASIPGLARAALLALVCVLSGCATGQVMSPGADGSVVRDDRLYQSLGGQAGIEGIVDDLLDAIIEDDRINTQFALAPIVRFRTKLIEQICSVSGGPCLYTGLSMAEAHAGRGIDDAQFNALVEQLIEVMTRRHVPVTAQNHLLRRLAPMHADVVAP